MKKYYKILLTITAFAMLFMTSCLDDENVGIEVPDFAGTPYIVDFNEMPTSEGYVIRSFEGTTDPDYAQEATFRINLSSPYTLDDDLNVTVEFGQAAIDAYMADNPGWTSLPADKHDFTTSTITIPAGEREAEFTVNFYTEGLSADDQIMAAFSITDVSNPDVLISGNFGTQLVKVGVANIFEGSYTADIDWYYGGGGNYGGLYEDWTLMTASSVASTTDYFYPWWNYPVTITVDINNPQTIDGIANAYMVTLDAAGKSGDDDVQLDDYDGGVWNYCYQDGGKWVFKLAHALTTGSGTHVSVATLTQN